MSPLRRKAARAAQTEAAREKAMEIAKLRETATSILGTPRTATVINRGSCYVLCDDGMQFALNVPRTVDLRHCSLYDLDLKLVQVDGQDQPLPYRIISCKADLGSILEQLGVTHTMPGPEPEDGFVTRLRNAWLRFRGI